MRPNQRIFSAAKSWIRDLADLPARRAHGRLLKQIHCCRQESPIVSFGGVLDDRKLVHGGAVKLLHLRKAFATDEACFNLLYLVSSAQPRFAPDLVKACGERGIRFVWNQNGVGYPAWAGAESERHNAPMRRLRTGADFVVYQSEFCRTSAEKFLGPTTAPSATLVNPVDLEFFHPAPVPLASRPLRLLAIGTQNYAARVFSCVECLKELRDGGVEAVLTIAGKLQWKDAETQLARQIETLGLRDLVTVHPAFSQHEAVRLYQGHHIVLHPKYLDPCPTVAIEALACGLPVVGSASGGMPELVPPACGRLVPAPLVWDRLITPSGPELAAAVQEIAPRWEEFSAAARAHAETHFDSCQWVARHAEIFHTLLK